MRRNAFAASAVVHGFIVAAILFVTASRERVGPHARAAPFDPPSQIVWLDAPGPGGGGGGGGKLEHSPARKAEVKGTDTATMPSAARATADTPETPAPPEMLPELPVQTLGASSLTAMGLVEGGAESLSHGPGRNGGFGSGDDLGAGRGSGPGVGPGDGGNMSGGPYKPGNGVTMPVPVHREQPQYTIEAMRARIEGAVLVECVVQPSGRCQPVRVVRSLDARLGLDQQALRAAAGWRFRPGVRLGEPVPVLVYIQIGFSIH